jgi:hypothetical protein
MVGRQPRHHHQKDLFVYRRSHLCLDRNPRYYRIVITAHLAVILSFLPFCQQISPCESQTRFQLGLETKFQRSIPYLLVHRPVHFLGYHMRWDPNQGYIISKFPQISQRPPGPKYHVIRSIGYSGRFQSHKGKAICVHHSFFAGKMMQISAVKIPQCPGNLKWHESLSSKNIPNLTKPSVFETSV